MIDFTPLPSDPDQLTPEHARLVFRGDIDGVVSDILRLALEPQPEPVEVAI